MSFLTSILAFALQQTDGSRWAAMKEGVVNPNLSKFLVIAAVLFIIGVAGVLTRRNIIVIFMSIELILNAANLNFIAFSRYLTDTGGVNAVAGQVFTVFVIVVAAAVAAIGLGIVIALYRNKETIWVDEIDILKW
jgi:NADH-quinone oxidoreductase subunit K